MKCKLKANLQLELILVFVQGLNSIPHLDDILKKKMWNMIELMHSRDHRVVSYSNEFLPFHLVGC